MNPPQEMKLITLIGYRGTGKSTVAPQLAQQLGWTWVDADAEIERRAGKSIRDIFAEGGEPAFRSIERAVLVDLLSQERTVIAAGGGAILNEQTRQDMRDAGPVIWLQASADTIEARIMSDATTAQRRPNLTNTGGRAEIETLLQQREPHYRACASLVVDTDTKSAEELVAEIVTSLKLTDTDGAAL